MTPQSEEQLEELLSRPSRRDIEAMRRLPGDVIILGAGGKMGPSLARRAQRAAKAAGIGARIYAVSRFSSSQARAALERDGVVTIACDLLDRVGVSELPVCENVLFLAGKKFGSTDWSDLTWAANTITPVNVAEHFRASRIVAFSTGNVYSFVDAQSGGSVESDAPDPRGEYAQSCLCRERLFEYYSREFGTRCLIFRLNYAVDLRYGVLVDIARKIQLEQPIDLTVARLNAIWQGDANSYALRSLQLCESPARFLNVTGAEIIAVREAAEFFAAKFQRRAILEGQESPAALLSNASLCHTLLGKPEVEGAELMEMVADWIRGGGASLDKPTKYEVTDGRY